MQRLLTKSVYTVRVYHAFKGFLFVLNYVGKHTVRTFIKMSHVFLQKLIFKVFYFWFSAFFSVVKVTKLYLLLFWQIYTRTIKLIR